MKLNKLLLGLDNLKAKGSLDVEIKGIESNSKNVKDGYMFIAIKGFSVDGHDYINNAIEAGAKTIMVQEGCDLKKIKLPADVTLIKVIRLWIYSLHITNKNTTSKIFNII